MRSLSPSVERSSSGRSAAGTTGSLLAVALVLMACAASHDARRHEGRAWDPKSVNPAWLEFLLSSLADTAAVAAAIDLDGAATSEMFLGEVETRGNVIRYRDRQTGVLLCSVHLGRTSDGIHVFRVWRSYGGSGIFENLLFVFYEEDLVLSEGTARRRRVLRSAGSYTLGDRTRARVSLEGDTVRICRSDGTQTKIVLTGLGTGFK